MAVKLGALRIDRAASVEGIWSEFDQGFEVKIASALTPEHEVALSEALAPWSDVIRSGKMTDELREKISKDVAARILIRDWRGLIEEDGAEIPYSPERALGLIEDPGMQHFWKWVKMLSMSHARYRAKLVASAEKN